MRHMQLSTKSLGCLLILVCCAGFASDPQEEAQSVRAEMEAAMQKLWPKLQEALPDQTFSLHFSADGTTLWVFDPDINQKSETESRESGLELATMVFQHVPVETLGVAFCQASDANLKPEGIHPVWRFAFDRP